MAPTLQTLLVALGFVFSAAVNASPSMTTDDPKAQPVGDCIVWYSPQLKVPPETCEDVVNMHPGLDLDTFFKLNPAIHPHCDNMQLGHKVCIRAIEQDDCPKPAEPSPQVLETSPSQWETSTTSYRWKTSPTSYQWKTSTTPKPQESSSTASYGWY